MHFFDNWNLPFCVSFLNFSPDRTNYKCQTSSNHDWSSSWNFLVGQSNLGHWNFIIISLSGYHYFGCDGFLIYFFNPWSWRLDDIIFLKNLLEILLTIVSTFLRNFISHFRIVWAKCYSIFLFDQLCGQNTSDRIYYLNFGEYFVRYETNGILGPLVFSILKISCLV